MMLSLQSVMRLFWRAASNDRSRCSAKASTSASVVVGPSETRIALAPRRRHVPWPAARGLARPCRRSRPIPPRSRSRRGPSASPASRPSIPARRMHEVFGSRARPFPTKIRSGAASKGISRIFLSLRPVPDARFQIARRRLGRSPEAGDADEVLGPRTAGHLLAAAADRGAISPQVRTTSAPTPFGPPSLCADSAIEARPSKVQRHACPAA
jgi:hypothetical protein